MYRGFRRDGRHHKGLSMNVLSRYHPLPAAPRGVAQGWRRAREMKTRRWTERARGRREFSEFAHFERGLSRYHPLPAAPRGVAQGWRRAREMKTRRLTEMARGMREFSEFAHFERGLRT